MKKLPVSKLLQLNVPDSYHPVEVEFDTGEDPADVLQRHSIGYLDLFPAQLKELQEINKSVGAPYDADSVVIYFPWERKALRILTKDNFLRVKTNRNQYKITQEEQALLQNKCIGIVGLSVGQATAITLAMEGIGGHFRIADMDTISLSNLNRLRARLMDLGEKKALLCAREMYNSNPYLLIDIYHNGLQEFELETFFNAGPKLDLLIEECDDLALKVQLRTYARSSRIPVVMDTNDKSTLDIERFDLEPDRALFHGLLGHIGSERQAELTPSEKVVRVVEILEADSLAARSRSSLLEVGATLLSWPQLASGVMMGAGLCVEAVRNIFLARMKKSGRVRFDLQEYFNSSAIHGDDVRNIQKRDLADRYAIAELRLSEGQDNRHHIDIALPSFSQLFAVNPMSAVVYAGIAAHRQLKAVPEISAERLHSLHWTVSQLNGPSSSFSPQALPEWHLSKLEADELTPLRALFRIALAQQQAGHISAAFRKGVRVNVHETYPIKNICDVLPAPLLTLLTLLADETTQKFMSDNCLGSRIDSAIQSIIPDDGSLYIAEVVAPESASLQAGLAVAALMNHLSAPAAALVTLLGCGSLLPLKPTEAANFIKPRRRSDVTGHAWCLMRLL